MLKRLQDLLRSPVFPDEQRTRRAELLNLLMLYSAGLSAVGLFLRRFEISTLWLLAFILATLYLWRLLNRGRVELVGWIFISLMWLILTYFMIDSGRVDSSATAGYTLVVLVAALALGRTAALVYLVLSVIAGGLVAYLNVYAGMLPPPERPLSAWVGNVILLVMIWLVISFAIKRVSEALDRAHGESRERQLMAERVLRQSRYLAALHQTTFSLIHQRDLHSLLETILSEAAQLLDTQDGYLDLVQPDGETAVQMVGIGIYQKTNGLVAGKGQGLTGQVWASGKAVIVDDYRTWPHRLAVMPGPLPQAIVGAPLKVGEEVIGVLGLAHMGPDRAFTAEQAEYLSQFAELASLAYQNAKLYEQAQAELAERTLAETTLAESQSRLHLVMQAAELGTWDWNLATDEFTCDEECQRMLGYAPGQAGTDLTWWAGAIHPDDRVRAMRSLKDHVDGRGPAFDLEVRMCGGDGRWRWLLLRGKVTSRDAEGRPLVVSGTQIEISRRVQMETTLREANVMLDSYSHELEHRTRLLMAASEISRTATGILDRDSLSQLAVEHIAANFGLYYAGLFLVDEEGHRAVLHAGAGEAGKQMLAAQHALEIGDTSMIGWCIAHSEPRVALDVGEDAIRFGNPLLRLTRSELALPLISRGSVLGALTIQSTQPSAFSREDIAVFQTMGDELANAIANAALYDQLQKELAQRRSVEVEIRRLNAELEKRVQQRTSALQDATREMEAFSYSVSHDLRAPLRSISSYSRILSKDLANLPNEEALRILQRIIDSASYMSDLIDDLLRLSRVTRQDLSLTTVNLSALARLSVEELEIRFPEHRPRVEVSANLTAHGDERLLRLALGNLLGNAWKFTGRTPDPLIRFGAERHNGEVVFYVRDNGVGFDMQYASKLFGTFQRLHAQDEFPGMGIGLAIVQRVIHRHGGRVWAEGKPREGAAFFFTLG